MFYRMTANINVLDPQAFVEIRDALASLVPVAFTIRPGEQEEEPSFITVHKCYHDTDPSIPCEVVFRRSTATY